MLRESLYASTCLMVHDAGGLAIITDVMLVILRAVHSSSQLNMKNMGSCWFWYDGVRQSGKLLIRKSSRFTINTEVPNAFSRVTELFVIGSCFCKYTCIFQQALTPCPILNNYMIPLFKLLIGLSCVMCSFVFFLFFPTICLSLSLSLSLSRSLSVSLSLSLSLPPSYLR